MKRFVICALAILAPAGMASAQDVTLWVQPVGGGNVICLEDISDTAVVQLWVDVHIPPGGQLVAMDAILTEYGDCIDVLGFIDHGPWGSFGRRDPRGLITVPGGNLNQYQFLGLDENQPWTIWDGMTGSGLSPGVHLLDEIIIHAIERTQDGPCPPPDYETCNQIMFSFTAAPGGFKVYPSYYTTGHYYDISVAFGTGRNLKGTADDLPLYVCVTPEPASLSLLLLGGLAAFRRR